MTAAEAAKVAAAEAEAAKAAAEEAKKAALATNDVSESALKSAQAATELAIKTSERVETELVKLGVIVADEFNKRIDAFVAMGVEAVNKRLSSLSKVSPNDVRLQVYCDIITAKLGVGEQVEPAIKFAKEIADAALVKFFGDAPVPESNDTMLTREEVRLRVYSAVNAGSIAAGNHPDPASHDAFAIAQKSVVEFFGE